MQKQAPTLGRLLTMALFALSCFGLLLFLWLSFGGPTPLKPKGYQFDVAFTEATQLGLEADVRVAGVSVGKLRKKDIDERANRTIATIEVDPKYAPIARDAKAILRQKTLLGETYIELTPGSPDGPKVPEGGRLEGTQVQESVQLDEIFQALDPVTRQAFRTWQKDLARGVRDRGTDLNDAFGNLPAFAADGRDLLKVLDSQELAVRRLVRNTGVVFGALSENEDQLRNLITNSSDVFGELAAENDALADTFKILPTFLDESRLTYATLERFSKNTDPLIRTLQPAVRDLGPTLRDARALAPDLERTFRSLDPLIDASIRGLPALRDILDGTRPLLAELQPFLEELNPLLEWLEYHQSTLSNFISNGQNAQLDTVPTRTDREMGHYLRQWGPTGAETAAMWPNRLESNRGNAYMRPEGATGPDHARFMIFPNFDCNNAPSNPYMTQIPDTDDIPSCFEQAPQAYPPGNTSKFPRLTRADYSKPAR